VLSKASILLAGEEIAQVAAGWAAALVVEDADEAAQLGGRIGRLILPRCMGQREGLQGLAALGPAADPGGGFKGYAHTGFEGRGGLGGPQGAGGCDQQSDPKGKGNGVGPVSIKRVRGNGLREGIGPVAAFLEDGMRLRVKRIPGDVWLSKRSASDVGRRRAWARGRSCLTAHDGSEIVDGVLQLGRAIGQLLGDARAFLSAGGTALNGACPSR